MIVDRRRRMGLLLLAGVALAGVSLAGGLESPGGLLERANKAVRDGRLARALELYEESDGLRPDDAYTLYNWGTALAMDDERGLAERMFRKADELAPSDDLRARARFNLARSLFVTASTLSEEDPRRAIELFDASARAAMSALEIDRSDVEAARHVEISRLAAKLVRDQLEIAERLEELARQQREQSQASQDTHRNREESREDGESPENQQEQDQQRDGESTPDKPGDERGEEAGEKQSDGGMKDLPSWLRGLGPERDDPKGSPKDTNQPEQNQQSEAQESAAPEGNEQETPGEPSPENPVDNPGDEDQRGSSDRPEDNPTQEPAGAGLGEAQQELSNETEGIAQTLRKAIENDLVAGDRDFAEAVLRAIEEARDAQDDAKKNLDEQEFADASADQEQAATLLDLAQQMMDKGGEQNPPTTEEPSTGEPSRDPHEGEQEGDENARRLLDKERAEREMRRNYQRRIMRGRRAPARDW